MRVETPSKKLQSADEEPESEELVNAEAIVEAERRNLIAEIHTKLAQLN